MRALILSTILLAACGSSETSVDAGHDLSAARDLSFQSDCGHPGDVGNSLGVGKFCMTIADCASNSKATVCTTLGSDTDFFCTMVCSSTGPADQCGENARCACDNGQCGCFPTACDKNGSD